MRRNERLVDAQERTDSFEEWGEVLFGVNASLAATKAWWAAKRCMLVWPVTLSFQAFHG